MSVAKKASLPSEIVSEMTYNVSSGKFTRTNKLSEKPYRVCGGGTCYPPFTDSLDCRTLIVIIIIIAYAKIEYVYKLRIYVHILQTHKT